MQEGGKHDADQYRAGGGCLRHGGGIKIGQIVLGGLTIGQVTLTGTSVDIASASASLTNISAVIASTFS